MVVHRRWEAEFFKFNSTIIAHFLELMVLKIDIWLFSTTIASALRALVLVVLKS